MRSSCETVLTKSDLTCSTSRSLEMSRKAKMRPATAPSGSRITASVTDSQTSSRPRMIGTSRSPRAAPSGDSRLRCSTSTGARPSATDGRDAGDPLGGAVPEHDLAVAVDGDDALGDVGEDRDRPLPLERDALVQLGVRERRRRARGDGQQRLDLLLAPLARLRGVDGENAERSLPRRRRPGRRGRRSGRPGASGRAREAARRRRRLRARPARPTERRRPRASRRRGSASRAQPPRLPLGRRDDELVAVEEPEGGGVGVDERRRLLHDLVEDGRRVELAREQPARARQLLREGARAALGLEQLAPLERAARRVGEMAGELEIVVAERPLLGEEDEDEPATGVARRVHRHGESER